MNTKLHSKILTMAAATLGLSLVGACSKKAPDPIPEESGEAASGAESSCGSGSCGAAHEGEKKGDEAGDAEDMPESADQEGGDAQ